MSVENKVNISGKILSGFVLDHEVYNDKFYKTYVSVTRYSGVVDVLPVIVSGKLVDVSRSWLGARVSIFGSIRTRNEKVSENHTKLNVYVFAEDICVTDDFGGEDINDIELVGYLTKQPICRETPKSRKIADFTLAVNTKYGHSYYIPCLGWGRDSVLMSRVSVGSMLLVKGRFQSRGYKKVLSDGSFEERVAYEVSAKNITIIEWGATDE